MTRRSGPFIAAISATILAAFASTQVLRSQTPAKAIVVAWDGAVPSLVHEMLGEGKLPNLSKLITSGAFADDVIPVFPSKTAPGFASLWTGAPPSVTGISGNRQPRSPPHQYTILESNVSFLSAPLRAEPIWSVALRAGRKVVLAHAPLGREQSEGAVKLLGYDGYAGRDGVINGRAVTLQPAVSWNHPPHSSKPPLECLLTIGASRFFGLFIDDPEDPRLGYDTLLVTTIRDGGNTMARLKFGDANNDGALWSGSIEVKTSGGEDATVRLRLFDLQPDASDFLLYHTRPARNLIFPSELAPRAIEAAGAFVGNGASLLYQEGSLGPTLAAGGDGLAESRYLETVALAQRQFKQTALWALSAVPWNLLFLYTPFPDEAEHLWRGYIDRASNSNSNLAAAARRFLEKVYESSDDLLGAVLANRPAGTIIAVVSDHGMEGVSKLVAINRVLERAGLLTLNDNGQPDLARTKAFYPPSNNAYLLINSTDRKYGIVTREQRPAIVRQLREALQGISDGGKSVITAIYDAQSDGPKMGIGGAAGGDLYLDLLPGYDFDARTGPGEIIALREPHGMHGFNPARPSMHTIMVLNGPGIAAGKRLKTVRLIDFAPTLARVLHLPALKDATGRVLKEALAGSR